MRDDHESNEVFNLLVVVAETGQMLESGGIIQQPAWFIEDLAWFLPLYSQHKFASQAAMIFGNGDDQKKQNVLPAGSASDSQNSRKQRKR